MLAEHLRRGQHQVGRRHSLTQLARDFKADDFRREHVQWLAEHHGLGLNPADAPADDSQTVDHRGMTVGPDERIRESDPVPRQHDFRQKLQVHLVHDPRRGRHDAEIVERLLAPAQELVPLDIPLKFLFHVELQRKGRRELVDLHRVVDHQVARHERIDFFRIALHPDHRTSQGGQVDDRRHAGEILQNHPSQFEGDFDLLGRFGVPVRQIDHVRFVDDEVVDVSQAGFQQHANRKRQRLDVADPVFGQLWQAINRVVYRHGS